jgi:AraC family transcriptional regulator of adaptative response/methylated-DNA-[protein]-cysteine methyltransferase
MLKRPSTVTTQKADPRWDAVVQRDRAWDGRFFFAVKTTGIYCRPSCGARTPRVENVLFFDSTALAQEAGFRACKRCKPDQPLVDTTHAALVTRLCALLDRAEHNVTLQALARHAAMGPFHLQRVFKAATGLSPAQYQRARRAQRLRAQLTQGNTVTNAILDAGYGSNSRFYEHSDAILGMTPTRYRDGGKTLHIQHCVAPCSLGKVLVASTTQGVCAILLGDNEDALLEDLGRRFPKATRAAGDAALQATVAEVIAAVEKPVTGLGLPLDVQGTAFQQRVWDALRKIPVGTTVTYAQLAQALGAPRSTRAVASACAANNVAVVIPCHRVVRGDGGLAGYAWGVERKAALLAREKVR